MKLSGGDKQVISVNQYLSTEECSDSNILQMFKWASTSEQAKQVNMLKTEVQSHADKNKDAT